MFDLIKMKFVIYYLLRYISTLIIFVFYNTYVAYCIGISTYMLLVNNGISSEIAVFIAYISAIIAYGSFFILNKMQKVLQLKL